MFDSKPFHDKADLNNVMKPFLDNSKGDNDNKQVTWVKSKFKWYNCKYMTRIKYMTRYDCEELQADKKIRTLKLLPSTSPRVIKLESVDLLFRFDDPYIYGLWSSNPRWCGWQYTVNVYIDGYLPLCKYLYLCKFIPATLYTYKLKAIEKQ